MFNPYYNQTHNLGHDTLSYSYINLVFLSLYISSVFSIGVSISFLIVGHYMKGKFFIVKDRYIDRIKDDNDNVYDDSDNDHDGEEEDNDEDKYYKELNRMSYFNKTLLDAKGVYNLRFKTIREPSPDGDDVIMTYNSDSGTFWYYCDNKDGIKFNTLDALARKFAIEHNCKCVCVNYKEELDKAFHSVDYSAVLKQLKKNNKIAAGAAAVDADSGGAASASSKNIYATFKTYNKTRNNNDDNVDTSPGKMKKHITNRFSYKGKLSEYKPFEEKEKRSNANDESISFAHFKKIQKEKEQAN